MNQELRTAAVCALCRQMLDSRSYEALPILADALQEAGCTDSELLAQCRDPNLKSIQADRLVSLVYSDETAAAVRWMEEFVRNINYRDYKDAEDRVGTKSDTNPHTYERIMMTGYNGLTRGGMSFSSDAGADYFRESDANRREFFRNWSLITGLNVPEDVLTRLSFSCSC